MPRSGRLIVATTALAVAAAAVVAWQPAGATRPPTPGRTSAQTGATLRSLADAHGLRIGSAVNSNALAATATYAQIAGDQFSTITPESAMKWGVVEPQQGTFDWTAAQAVSDFAAAHGQKLRGHALVWQNQLPTWLTGGTWTKAQLRSILHNHITKEVTHFKGHVWQWDVVNEALADDGTLRDDLWSRSLGSSYIGDSFRWAHQSDPKALLFYNDYNIEPVGAKSNALYALVKSLLQQGVPINGVGFQTHLNTQTPFPATLQQNLQRFADLGLKVALTEVDVRTPVPVTATDEATQDGYYSQSLSVCLHVSACISYTVWEFGDAYSWVPATFPGYGSADIYDQHLVAKSEYSSLQSTLSG